MCWRNATPGAQDIDFPGRERYVAGLASSAATPPTLLGPSRGPQRTSDSLADGTPPPPRARHPASAEHPPAAGPSNSRAPHQDRSDAANTAGPVTPVTTGDVQTNTATADRLKSILTLNRIQPRSKPAAGRGYFQHITRRLGHI